MNLNDVKSHLNVKSLANWVIRVTAILHSHFMGETRDGYVETRMIHSQLKFGFAGGAKTAVFKPGMPFERDVYLMYEDGHPLAPDKLASATLRIQPIITSINGQIKMLPDIVVPAKGEYLNSPIDKNQNDNEFNDWMQQQVENVHFNAFRQRGVHHLLVGSIFFFSVCF